MLPHQRSPPHYWLLQHVASLKTYREYMRFMAPTKSKLTCFSNLECKYEANCGSTISILKDRKGPIRTNQLKGREWSHNLGRVLWTLFDGLLWGSAYDTKRGLVSALHFDSKATNAWKRYVTLYLASSQVLGKILNSIFSYCLPLIKSLIGTIKRTEDRLAGVANFRS